MPDARESLAKFIRWVMRDTKYAGTYACTVQGQTGQLLDLLPDDPTIAGKGLSGISIRHGLPGCSVTVRTGARVLLAFENRDPTKPYAALWSEGDITSVSVGYGGTKPVARIGDTVSVFFPPAITFAGFINVTTPISGTMVITTAAPGIIDGSGNPKFLA
jgi:hypothetical protein